MLFLLMMLCKSLFSQDFSPIDPLEVIQFEPIHVLQDDNGRIEVVLQLTTKDSFSLYTDKVSFQLPTSISHIATIPPLVTKQYDKILEKEVSVYSQGNFRLLMQAQEPLSTLALSIRFTGCTTSVCLFPATWSRDLKVTPTDEDIEDAAFDAAYDNASERISALEDTSADSSQGFFSAWKSWSILLASVMLATLCYIYLRKQFWNLVIILGLLNVVQFYYFKDRPFEWIRVEHPREIEELSNNFHLIYYAADWCMACKRMDVFTFKDQNLYAELKSFSTIKIDLTNDAPDFAEMTRLDSVDVLPTIVLVDISTQRRTRLSGYYLAGSLQNEIKKFKDGANN